MDPLAEHRAAPDAPALLRPDGPAWAWARWPWRRCSIATARRRPRRRLRPAPASRVSRNFAPRAKRVIYLFQSGAPSQMDLFDYKPQLRPTPRDRAARLDPMGQRLTGMTSRQDRLPGRGEPVPLRAARPERRVGQRAAAAHRERRRRALLHQVDAHRGDQPRPGRHLLPDRGPARGPAQHRRLGGLRPGEREPGPAGVRGHDLAGHGQPQRPAALRPALGQRLPADDVPGGQVPLASATRSSTSRIRPASSPTARRRMLDDLARLDAINHREFGDPEILTRIAQYELAFRMQTSVPELTDLSNEPESRLGDVRPRCATARDVCRQLPAGAPAGRARRAVHPALPSRLGPAHAPAQPDRRPVPRHRSASAALVRDLKQRGLLDDTLVVWGGEFGRTVYCQGRLTADDYGRDHHPRCFTVWLAGGGIKPGITYGATDDFGYNIIAGPGPRPRPARHDPALPGHRPHPADLPVPGPALPADRRARQGGQEDPGLKAIVA